MALQIRRQEASDASRLRDLASENTKLLVEAHLDINTLKSVFGVKHYLLAVRTDNGPELTSRAFMAWATAHGVRHIFIQPGRPMQNGYIESFNGKFVTSA